jgi:ATP-binding protein involved in chromosome partitioning
VAVSRDAVLEALEGVIDPEFRRSVVELEIVRDVAVEGSEVSLTIALISAGGPQRASLERQVEHALRRLHGVERVKLAFAVMSDEEQAAVTGKVRAAPTQRVPGISIATKTRVIALGSGKGGVGKSSLSANLAAAFSLGGHRAGVLDADLYGYSIPQMLGVRREPTMVGTMVVPPVARDVEVMSVGFFVDRQSPVMLRGPMLHKALEQFVSEVLWGDLDVLLVDMPPGTGDVALSLGQLLPRAEAIVITTPQRAAQQVAVRAGQMARQTNMELVGAVENMSYLAREDGTREELFGAGGGETLAREVNVPLLARIPFDPLLGAHADAGEPVVWARPDLPVSRAIVALAETLTRG